MTDPNRYLKDLEELDDTLRELTGHIAALPFDKRTQRDAELTNLMTIAQCTLNFLHEIPEEEVVETIANLRKRVRQLQNDPESAGKSGEIASEG